MSEIRTIRPSDHFPYSHATVHNGVVYVSGQTSLKPGTQDAGPDDVAEQTRRTFACIDALLDEAGTTRSRIIRCGCYLKHIEKDFAAFNACYREWLGDHRPARTTVEVAFAFSSILVEVDCIAAVD